MIISITFILALLALLVAVASAVGRAPLWVAVVLLAVLALLGVVPR